MKKTGRILILIAAILVCVLLNVILFLTVPDARLKTTVFWLAWSFTFPLNLAAYVAIFAWTGKKTGDAIVQMPIAYWVSQIFCVIYLAVGILFMYFPFKHVTLPLIIELIITVAYAVIGMYAIFGAEYIMSDERQVKQKVLFIRLLQNDVEGCIAYATDPAVKSALLSLAEKVRFSDPMSHPSLAGVEAELSTTVGEISMQLSAGNVAGATELIRKAEIQLERRNSRCIILK